ncbi:ATPase [Planosporangium flavigriseum]|uniref:Kinase n=1 Tax=Planosporangium flavigriseum TaxID=373681 RepID=A0A8J3LLM4_9ACTN|nr:BadF/BadG/BcrA/BcrD ATPase family protein [Planosporangium flavigriseum]NJC64963.1 ATPase [Planosporangium flavigriseum]GIG72838.1 kinase [Planosporangium flavigriseum]
MTLFLAVDGGNSKTDVVLGTAAGEVLAFVRGPGSSPHSLGVPGSMHLLDSLIAKALLAKARSAADVRVDLVAVYLAGADLPVEVARLRSAIGSMGWAAGCVVDNDTFALLRAGTSRPDAIAVVSGAGINCVGRTADGRSARFPSLGEISGDWGGGQHLAQLALWHAARGEDGRGRPTTLSAAVAAHFGRPTVGSVSQGLHLGEIPYARIGELSPVLFTAAAAGDEVAGAIVEQQVAEILALHRVAADRLGLRDAPHAVVLGGGVLRARHSRLHEPLLAGIRAQAPHAEVTVVTDPPVVGAALLALEALGAGPGAERALRQAIRNPCAGTCDRSAARTSP